MPLDTGSTVARSGGRGKVISPAAYQCHVVGIKETPTSQAGDPIKMYK